MSKKLGVSPKEEASVTAEPEAQARLFDAFPRRRGENLKCWFPRVARELNALARNAGLSGSVTPRRIRAIWHGEARRIDHYEIRMLELRERLNLLQQKALTAHGELNALAQEVAAGNRRGNAARDSGGAATPGRRGAREGESGNPGAQEEAPLIPLIRFSPRMTVH